MKDYFSVLCLEPSGSSDSVPLDHWNTFLSNLGCNAVILFSSCGALGPLRNNTLDYLREFHPVCMNFLPFCFNFN